LYKFYFSVVLRGYVKHTRQCLTTFLNTLEFIKNTLSCIIFSTLLLVFGNAILFDILHEDLFSLMISWPVQFIHYNKFELDWRVLVSYLKITDPATQPTKELKDIYSNKLKVCTKTAPLLRYHLSTTYLLMYDGLVLQLMMVKQLFLLIVFQTFLCFLITLKSFSTSGSSRISKGPLINWGTVNLKCRGRLKWCQSWWWQKCRPHIFSKFWEVPWN